MFQGFTDETFEFFMAISFNNNTEFFHDNHDWYLRAVRQPCLELAGALSDVIEEIDDDLDRRPNRAVSRLNRDVRFSRDKSPYRDYIWVSFHRPMERLGFHEVRDPMPGFYFDISANSSSFGMGSYGENRPLMNGLRRRLLSEPEAFLEALRPTRDDFTRYMDAFKRMKLPENLRPGVADWYPVRSFYLQHDIGDFGLLKSPALVDYIAEGFRKLKPFYRYLVSIQPEADEDRTREKPGQR